MRAVLYLALLGLVSPALAQDEGPRPIVRAQIETESPVMVGETVILSVDVLTPTWFPRAPQLPAALPVENAVAVFDESFRTNLSEGIEGESWSGIRRRYLIHPQLAGAYTVPPIEVEIVYALPNARPSEPLTLAGPSLTFEARVPPEAAGLDYFIAARDFSLEQEVEPGVEGLRVGDAVSRTITLRATDASSMMLPITEFPEVDGLAVYPDPTRARDTGGERGEARKATRVDGASYVLETEGSYSLPPIERSWWDVSAGRLRQVSVPAVSFDVAPNPDLGGEIALPEEPDDAEALPIEGESRRWWRSWEVTAGLAAVVLLAWVAHRYGPRLRARWQEARRQRHEAEAAYFQRILTACRRNDASSTMTALLAWVDRVTPPGQSPTLGRLLATTRDDELFTAVRDLERALYGEGGLSTWRGASLARGLERARDARHDAQTGTISPVLSLLNPPGPD
jgi:hypothetical protein